MMEERGGAQRGTPRCNRRCIGIARSPGALAFGVGFGLLGHERVWEWTSNTVKQGLSLFDVFNISDCVNNHTHILPLSQPSSSFPIPVASPSSSPTSVLPMLPGATCRTAWSHPPRLTALPCHLTTLPCSSHNLVRCLRHVKYIYALFSLLCYIPSQLIHNLL
jgi:hypothetical protein